jgi:hypothetical protein
VTAMDQLWQELWGTPLTGIATTLVAYELGCIAILSCRSIADRL